MGSGSTIPYQLRQNKLIERDLFIEALKILSKELDFSSYRYVGFGAAFLEDFKKIHNELGIIQMDCIEYSNSAFQRQEFNNPFRFLELKKLTSTDYITEGYMKEDIGQIIWLDYSNPKELAQQLLDLEMISEKMYENDILKFTFNASPKAFKDKNSLGDIREETILDFLKNSPDFSRYLPVTVNPIDIKDNFSGLLRTMGKRAIERGLHKQSRKLVFTPLACFHYSDGQAMTTVTGLITLSSNAFRIINKTELRSWKFFTDNIPNKLLNAHYINVPAMTYAERAVIDKYIPIVNIDDLISQLPFSFEDNETKNRKLIEGYCTYYKYLPYFAKITY